MALLIGAMLSIDVRRAAADEVHADQHVQHVEAAPTAHAEPALVYREPTREYVTGPRRRPLRNGLWTLSVMYVTSVVVAVVSPRAVDDYLFIPVAGPWLDLGNRDAGGNGRYELLYKVLLITDGVFQALGAIQIALSLIIPETRLVTVANGQEHVTFAWRAAPLVTQHALGLQAGGRF